jgi:glycerol kinase
MVEHTGAGGSPLLVGLDVGTTNVKAVVCDLTGRTVALASVPQETLHPRAGWADFDPERLWGLACEVLRRVVREVDRPQRIVGVGVASFGEAGVLIDEHGRPSTTSSPGTTTGPCPSPSASPRRPTRTRCSAGRGRTSSRS